MEPEKPSLFWQIVKALAKALFYAVAAAIVAVLVLSVIDSVKGVAGGFGYFLQRNTPDAWWWGTLIGACLFFVVDRNTRDYRPLAKFLGGLLCAADFAGQTSWPVLVKLIVVPLAALVFSRMT